MSVARYLEGVLVLGFVLGPHCVTGWLLRRRLVPAWRGATAVLAQAVLSVSSIVLTAELLGAVGQFRSVALGVGALVVLGLTVVIVRETGAPPAPHAAEPDDANADADAGPPSALGWLTIAAVVGLTMAQAGTYAVDAARRGILEPDSVIYHLPFAGSFVQTGSLTAFHFVYPEFPWHLNPSTGELFHAFGLLAFDNESLTPVINLGWLALALLAGWCVGRPYGRSPLTLLGAAIVVDAPVMINAGGAENDVAAVALVLAMVAFLLHRPRWTPSHLVLAGLAAGLAISVKLPALPIVGVTVVLVLAVMPRASRTRAGAVFAGSVLVTGSYWYVRNLVRTGSPLSSVSLVVFPSASFAIVDRFGYSVADYLRHPGLAREVLPPLVHFAWGPAWLLTFGLAGAGAVVAAIDRDRLLRVLGIASLVAVAVWLVTPTTALGEFGQPLLFPSNSRYVAPALAVALTVAPLVRRLSSPRSGVVVGVLYALALLVGATNGMRASWVTDQLLGGVVVGVVAVAALWGMRGSALSRSVAAAVAIAGVGWFVLTGTSHRADAVGLARWAESIPPAHIGVESGVVTSWFLYGDHLANTVE
ncbi:MAG: hypothetical protein QOJ67_843, partial [Acidimicrobiaceae bacterium]